MKKIPMILFCLFVLAGCAVTISQETLSEASNLDSEFWLYVVIGKCSCCWYTQPHYVSGPPKTPQREP